MTVYVNLGNVLVRLVFFVGFDDLYGTDRWCIGRPGTTIQPWFSICMENSSFSGWNSSRQLRQPLQS